ncbi:MAG: delta-60 repeat domain-containing protein [Verrucomicrobia bacterium]|nr:delta-60 repeat domain-containing protein [Verrucomicrobiota bacterium]
MKAPFSIPCLLLAMLASLAMPLYGQNVAPTDIILTPSSVSEGPNTYLPITTLSAVDANPGDTHIFSLTGGPGSTDNGTFYVFGNGLYLNGGPGFDFELKNSYSIRVWVHDGNGGVLEKALTLSVINRNEPPSATLAGDQTVTNVYNTPQTVTGFVTFFDDGDFTVTQSFTVTTTVLSGAEIFSVAPSVSTAGVLTYTPNGTEGVAQVQVTMTDDNSINGDPALSTSTTFQIRSSYSAGVPNVKTLNLNSGGTVQSIGIQRDGTYIVGGTFTTALGTARGNIARINADHTLDTSFNPRANGAVTAIVVQPDGKILIAGAFTTLQPNTAPTATTRNRIARLNTDGTLDTSFNPNASTAVNALSLQPDGKILIGGAFTTLQPNGAATATTRNRIARLNADGTLDTSFNPNAGNIVHTIAQQIDGRILIGGTFTTLQPNGAATATGWLHHRAAEWSRHRHHSQPHCPTEYGWDAGNRLRPECVHGVQFGFLHRPGSGGRDGHRRGLHHRGGHHTKPRGTDQCQWHAGHDLQSERQQHRACGDKPGR